MRFFVLIVLAMVIVGVSCMPKTGDIGNTGYTGSCIPECTGSYKHVMPSSPSSAICLSQRLVPPNRLTVRDVQGALVDSITNILTDSCGGFYLGTDVWCVVQKDDGRCDTIVRSFMQMGHLRSGAYMFHIELPDTSYIEKHVVLW